MSSPRITMMLGLRGAATDTKGVAAREERNARREIMVREFYQTARRATGISLLPDRPAVTRQHGLAVPPQLQTGGRGGIRGLALQPFPENVVEIQRIDAIFDLEVHSLHSPRPVPGVV